MTTSAIVYSISAAIGFLACAYWASWVRIRHHGVWTPNRAATVGYSGLFGLASFLSIPPVVAMIDAIVGVPELPRLFKHLCVFALATCTQYQLLHLAYPAQVAKQAMRRRVALTAAGSALLVVMYALVRAHPGIAETKVEYAHVPAVTAYLAVYIATLSWYAVDTPRLCWKFSRVSPRRWTRRGFLIAAIGSSVTIAYCAAKAFYVSSYWIGVVPVGERVVSPLLVLTAGGLCMVGLSMPTWGPSLDVVGRRWRDRRTYRLLYPLWHALTGASPGLVLDERLRGRRAPLRGTQYALARRVVEICDARLALRPYIDARSVEQFVAGSGDADAGDAAWKEAVRIGVGLQERRAGRLASPPSTEAMYDPPGGYDGQVAWLSQVAAAFRSGRLQKALGDASLATADQHGVANTAATSAN